MDSNLLKHKILDKEIEDLLGGTREPSTNDLIANILKIARYWYLFAIALAIAGGLAYIKTLSGTEIYQTATTILIEDSQSNLKPDFTSTYGNKNVLNQMIVYSSHDFISKAIDKLNLTCEIYAKKRFNKEILYKQSPFDIEINYLTNEAYGREYRIDGIDDQSFSISYQGDKEVPAFKLTGQYGEFIQHALFFIKITKTDCFVQPAYELYFRFYPKNALANSYGNRLSALILGENSSVIEISLTGQVPQRDVDFLNVMNQQFFENNLARKNEIAERSVEFLEEQIAIMEKSIDASEEKLNTYQSMSGLYNTETSSAISKELAELNVQKNQVQLQKNYIKLLSDGISDPDHKILPDPSSYQIINPALNAYIIQYNAVLSELKILGKENPVYKKNTIVLHDLKLSINRSVENMNNTISMHEEQIDEQYNKALEELAGLPQQERQLLNYERDFKLNDNYRTYLMQKKTESQILKASNTPDNLIIDKPRVVDIVNINRNRNIFVIYIFIGLFIPFAFVVCKEFLFKFAIQSRDEAEKITGLPVLGVIEQSKKKATLMVRTYPRSSFAEGFRNLRSKVEHIAQKSAPLSILITSTEPNDGKTFIALNMASVYEIANKKVIVVDFDLRKPALTKTLGYENVDGVSNYLSGKTTPGEIIHHHNESGLDFIPAGTIPPNPSELVRSGKTKELLDYLEQRYDYILIDCSPAGLVSDVYCLSHLVNAVLYVIRNEKTNRNFLRHTTKELRDDGIKNIALIYNDVNIKNRYYYTKHGNYYHND